jgi:hypothetical protein
MTARPFLPLQYRPRSLQRRRRPALPIGPILTHALECAPTVPESPPLSSPVIDWRAGVIRLVETMGSITVVPVVSWSFIVDL